jgi:hypothetical protein
VAVSAGDLREVVRARYDAERRREVRGEGWGVSTLAAVAAAMTAAEEAVRRGICAPQVFSLPPPSPPPLPPP